MDSDNPNRPEDSHDQQAGQPSGSSGNADAGAPQGQPMGGYSPPPAPGSYSQPQTPTTPPQGNYGQPQYSDRPASQGDQPQYGQPYGDRPQAPQAPQGDYRPQYSDQPQQSPYGQPNQGYQQPQQPYYNQPTGMNPPPNQVNVPPKKSNNGMLFGLIGLVVLALAAGAIWYFVSGKNGNNPLNPISENGSSVMSAREVSAANALPSNTLGYISVATNIEGSQKAAFDKIREVFEAQPGYKETVDKLMQQATGSTGGANSQASKMAQEIQGLIAKYTKQISIAVLPPSTTDWEAMKSGGQLAMGQVAIRNIVAIADMDLAQLKKDAKSTEVAETTSSGVEISKIVSGTLLLYAAPLDGSNVAIGLGVEPVRAVIEQSKNKSGSVRETDTYKYLSGSVPAERVASFYLNLTDLYNQIQTVNPDILRGAGIESMSGGILFTVSGQEGGMQLDFASQADIKSNLTTQVAMTGKPDGSTFNDIPSDSLGFLVSTDLKTIVKSALDSMSAASKRNGATDPVDQAEQGLQQMAGVSIQNDIIPLLGGDFALSASAGDKSMPVSSVVFQLKLNGGDRDKAAGVVDKLMAALGKNTRSGFPSFDAAGGKFYDLGSAMGSSSSLGLVAGVSKDRFMVVYTPTSDAKSKVDDISNGMGNGFGKSPKWDEAKLKLPKDSNAVFYLDTDTLRAMYDESIASMSSEAQVFLKPFKYVVMGSANAAANRGVLRIFFGISK